MSPKSPQFVIPSWLAPHIAEVRAWPAVSGRHPRCAVTVCDRSTFSLGLCVQHYQGFRQVARRRRQPVAEYVAACGDEVRNAPPIRASHNVCWVEVCDHSAVSNGLCHPHSMTARRRFKSGPAERGER